MKIIYRDVNKVIPENEKAYFSILEGIINSVDELATLEVRRNPNNYSFRIAITTPDLLALLINELNNLHTMLSIRVLYSKSIRSCASISYKISL